MRAMKSNRDKAIYPPRITARLTHLGSNALLAALSDCAAFEDVRREVEANYSENRWWPTSVKDWRLRMLVAGWSTRVSYSHIAHYQQVVNDVRHIGWEQLLRKDDNELARIVAPLGLGTSRIRYLRSLEAFISPLNEEEIIEGDNDVIISNFANNVEGAGYKVAQCAILYAKGYHCGIIPIDSGMVEMLGPIVPTIVPTGPVGHEIVRKWLENITLSGALDIYEIASSNGYALNLPSGAPPTWWVHLTLIYYKRLYWNRRRLKGPFRRETAVTLENEDHHSPSGFVDKENFPGILLEGIDGAGKTSIAELLRANGYEYSHATYVEDKGIFERYLRQIEAAHGATVLDRSFISEYVYGKALRGESRLSLEECKKLIGLLADRSFVVFHLEEDSETIANRRIELKDRLDEIKLLLREYRKFFDAVRHIIPVYSLRASQLAPDYILNYISGDYKRKS